MYLDESQTTIKGKTYTKCLLRQSYREDGKVKHRTIANFSRSSDEEKSAIRFALLHKKGLSEIIGVSTAPATPSLPVRDALKAVSLTQGLSVGAVWLLHETARRLGIADALGSTRQGKLALWQVIARVIDQGSRLSAVRLAGSHAACDILGLDRFDEDDLYANLDWLAGRQSAIEDALLRKRPDKPGLYLYDVTSSYLEGTENELGAFGYNRDGKRGKRQSPLGQIVIGLLCDEEGVPLSIEVFPGNTQDPATFASQIDKVARRFGGGAVTFVGDRGMIKSPQRKELGIGAFHYITAITKAQIETLLKKGTIQLGLFDTELAEVQGDDGIRYILRRNPVRMAEIRRSKEERIEKLERERIKLNTYLAEHTRADPVVALKNLNALYVKLRLPGWVVVEVHGRELTISLDPEARHEDELLDGCYVLVSDLPTHAATKETIHSRYKDLAHVESAFRSSKTAHLELRPIHVRLADRTRGHVFVVMLAYRIIQELAKLWQELDTTVEEGIGELSTLCAHELSFDGKQKCNRIPEPRESIQRLLSATGVRMPEALPCRGIIVTTKKKLTERRKGNK